MKTDFREVWRTFNVAEADLIFSRLQGGGLHPSLQNDQAILALGWGNASGGVRVMVQSEEYDEAVRLLSE